jgi:hypothetical protein
MSSNATGRIATRDSRRAEALDGRSTEPSGPQQQAWGGEPRHDIGLRERFTPKESPESEHGQTKALFTLSSEDRRRRARAQLKPDGIPLWSLVIE